MLREHNTIFYSLTCGITNVVHLITTDQFQTGKHTAYKQCSHVVSVVAATLVTLSIHSTFSRKRCQSSAKN